VTLLGLSEAKRHAQALHAKRAPRSTVRTSRGGWPSLPTGSCFGPLKRIVRAAPETPRRACASNASTWTRRSRSLPQSIWQTDNPMNRPESPNLLIPIPDVQAERDDRQLAIERVGIKGLRYPCRSPTASDAGDDRDL
jgi:hypothetical protein